jgi:hypothetical protein
VHLCGVYLILSAVEASPHRRITGVDHLGGCHCYITGIKYEPLLVQTPLHALSVLYKRKRDHPNLSLGNYFRIFKIEFAYFLFGRIYITLQKATATSLCDVPVIKCWSLVYICVCERLE